MAVTIRLRRIGRKKQPSYRVVVTDSANPRGGKYLDTLGFSVIADRELVADLDDLVDDLRAAAEELLLTDAAA